MKIDKRIIFLGKLQRENALKVMKQATVLVNPRQNNEEFTKYSFPSKTLEYLASGIPLIGYKLDGIPDEYDRFICYAEDNTIETLSKKIKKICEMSDKERYELGKQGQSFVLNEKNYVIQSKKILDVVDLVKRV